MKLPAAPKESYGQAARNSTDSESCRTNSGGATSVNVIYRSMRRQQTANIIVLLFLFSGLTSCGQTIKHNDYVVLFADTIKDEYGYKTLTGDTIVPLGKYTICFTDTFRSYAIVSKPSYGFVAIDRQENVLYKVFPYDNGPDYTSDGLFRILENNKIGFADSTTGKIVIEPNFDCAFPFENGVAKVSIDCKTQSDGEHNTWLSDNWYYIDKTGKKVDKPKTIKE